MIIINIFFVIFLHIPVHHPDMSSRSRRFGNTFNNDSYKFNNDSYSSSYRRRFSDRTLK